MEDEAIKASYIAIFEGEREREREREKEEKQSMRRKRTDKIQKMIIQR